MMKSTKSTKAATLSVDYTPEVAKARAVVVKAAQAYKSYANRGDGVILPQCVEAVRTAKASGFLVDGRTPDAPAGSVGKAEFGRMFGLTSGSEVTFWSRLALALDAGVTVGDALWLRLATRKGPGKPLLAKRAEVGKVIEEGGSLADIVAACDAVETAAKAARKAQPDKSTESPETGVPTSDDPIADALLAILGLGAACKRIPAEDKAGWAKVAAALAKVVKRESTLRPVDARPTRTRKVAAPKVETDLAPAM